MSRASRWRDKLRGWKRIFLQNWALFKASKIGLIGLGIMLFFIILALAAPYMGLRDPMWWRAPDQDIVQVTPYFPQTGNNSVDFGYRPITHAIAMRVVPYSLGLYTDRLYVAAGSRLYTVEPTNGQFEQVAWGGNGYIDFANEADPDPTISVDPVVVNFGNVASDQGANFWVYVATASGNVYAINDSNPSAYYMPKIIKVGTMDGPATGLVVYSGDGFATWTPYDMVAASSAKGSVYAWQVNETGHHGPRIIRLGTKPIHMAGQPMRGTSPYPLFSPAFYYTSSDRTRPYLYVGSEDGNLTALAITANCTMTPAWTKNLNAQWSSAPVVQYVINDPINGVVVFAASDSGNISALYYNGSWLKSWSRPSPILQSVLQADGGKLTQPYLAQDTTDMLVGSSTGWVYSIDYLTYPMTVNWRFRDTTSQKTYISASPVAFGGTLVFFASNNDLGAPGPSPEDVGTIFAFDIDKGTQSWSVTADSAILAAPTAMKNYVSTNTQLFFATHAGSVYSFSTTGLYLIPSEPSWIHQYPSGNTYIFGLDNRGRDIWSQWVWGSRIALYVGFLAAFFSISIGTMMGLVAGYFGGRIEAVLMRFTDVILVIPGLPLIIALASVLGSSVNNLILVIALVGWPGTARVVRSQVLSLKERPFIESARVTGASHARIMGRHILPNVLPLAFLYMTFAVSGAILSEASLSFIGLGDINTVSWGRMLQDVTQSQALKAWWWLLPPGLAITMISLGFFLVGRAFDEIVNPRLRKR